ncbi:glycosyltransferase [Lichenihabitans psoromatis]|uniref:glycosyltransferase n=1 Tax=Lichenihabitans psoromatis TaxID=2528642 RepID=UPI0010357D25|nr:glycosyltransferase [Lichenihabitans psoromatis]
MDCHYVPLGVETDIFHPWGESNERSQEPTFLWFSRNQHRKGYDVLRSVWSKFRLKMPKAKLIVMGHGILTNSDIPTAKMRRWREYLIYEDVSLGVTFKEIIVPLSDRDVAKIYRSVDCVLVTSRSEGFGFNVVEAMACGVMVVFPEYGGTGDMVFPGALTYGGAEVKADYSDKGFYDVGNWWEPNENEILTAMHKVLTLTAVERRELLRKQLNLVRTSFSWRNTGFSVRKALLTHQTKRSKDYFAGSDVLENINAEWLVGTMESGSSQLLPLSTVISSGVERLFADFDRATYEEFNDDIKGKGVDPLWHFIMYGWSENRFIAQGVLVRDYLSNNNGAQSLIIHYHQIGMTFASSDLNRSMLEWTGGIFKKSVTENRVSDRMLLTGLYKMVLRRDPDAQGLQEHLAALFDKRVSRAEMVDNFLNSEESHKVNRI